MKKIPSVLLILLIGFNTMTFAGTQVVMQEFKKGKPGKESVVISVDGSLLRMDNKGAKASGDQNQMVFDTSKKIMLIIDHEDKTFSRMDEAFFKQVNEQMLAVKKQMDAQLAKMPEAQRDMMRGMMEKMMGGSSQKKERVTKFVKTARTDKIAGYRCKVTEYLVNGKKRRELCLTPISNIDGAETVLEAMKGMSEVFEELFQSMEQMLPVLTDENPFRELEKLDGYPVAITEFKKNNVSERNQLVSIESKSFDKAFFEPPKGYKEKKMEIGR